MSMGGDEFAIAAQGTGNSQLPGSRLLLRHAWLRLRSDPRYFSLAATVVTTFLVFAIFLGQGIIIARLLGPAGRGEFGTCLYFPRDILLYAGLLGSLEIVNSYAAQRAASATRLKFSAARLGLITGCLTAVVAALFAVTLLIATERQYLIPYALLCCLFLPLEHLHLTISAVDRGSESYARYNVNRLLLALSFPILVGLAWMADLAAITGVSWLWLVCGLWVVSRIVGVLPTLRGMHLLNPALRRQQLKGPALDMVPGPRKLLREGRPFAVSMFVSEFFERLDIFLVLALASITDAGFYFVAVPAAAMLTIAPNALGVFTFNAAAQSKTGVSRIVAVRVMLATATFQLVSAVIFALIVGDLILLCFTDRFAASIPLVLLLLPASAIRGFLQAADGYLKGRGKPMIGVWSRSLSILVMLVFVWLTWGSLGLPAIPVAAGLGQAFAMLIIVTAIWQDCEPGQGKGSTS